MNLDTEERHKQDVFHAISRYPIIMRIEFAMRRKEYLSVMKLSRDMPFDQVLWRMITAIDSIPERYLEKLFPCAGSHWRYPEAKKLIETADLSGKMKEQMLFLLKKASRCRSLTVNSSCGATAKGV